jgi:hypothetical protein
MISINLKEGILQFSKKRLGVFVEKSTFPGIQKQDEVVEINNVPVDILDETAFQRQISELSFCNLLILPNDKQQLVRTCLEVNNIYCEKSKLTTLTKVQYSTDSLIKVIT